MARDILSGFAAATGRGVGVSVVRDRGALSPGECDAITDDAYCSGSRNAYDACYIGSKAEHVLEDTAKDTDIVRTVIHADGSYAFLPDEAAAATYATQNHATLGPLMTKKHAQQLVKQTAPRNAA